MRFSPAPPPRIFCILLRNILPHLGHFPASSNFQRRDSSN